MTPGARVGAAIAILDRILGGAPAEQALTGWARASRFAGSGDRAAVRDLVFGGLRRLRSLTALAGAAAPSGRALMIGQAIAGGAPPEGLFTGEGHAPPPLSADEVAAARAADPASFPPAVALDCPDWLWPEMQASLGADCAPALAAMQARAPVFVRANLARTSRAAAAAVLAEDGLEAAAHPEVATALEITANAGKLRQSRAYLSGLVELQDLSPQAAVAALPVAPGARVLDFCAGGGGKALALAARGAQVTAHDAAPQRMRDLGPRAARAGARIAIAGPGALEGQRFDLVLIDVPCSGSGTWRRTPGAKWALSAARLAELVGIQAAILAEAARLVAPGGALAYMTCSLLACENQGVIAAFLRSHGEWQMRDERRVLPQSGGDGFFSTLLTH